MSAQETDLESHRARRAEALRAHVKRMCYRSYPLAKLYYRGVIRHGYPRGDPIVIYQMGKVGSKTVERSLSAQTRDRPIFHVHFLTQEGLRREEAFYRQHWSKDKGGVHVWE